VISDPGASARRRYLLGVATEDDFSASERAYFGDEAALDRMAAAEDDLVEDYLDDRLTPEERRQFDQPYLSTTEHRVRVEMVRRLRTLARTQHEGRGAPPFPARLSGEPSYRWLGVAAALLMTVAATWMLVPRRPARTVAENPPAAAPNMPPQPAEAPGSDRTGAPSSRSPQVFAVSLSPAAVRSASASAAIVIPPDSDVVGLRLEGEGPPAIIGNARAAIRTVAGAEIWQGQASANDQPIGVVARVDVPAGLLKVDDYVVVLFGADRSGAERERYRYFLRVRSR